MHKAIVGTAGHVDHGKTTLLKALTGIDCDRLPEEKAREITIDLGFAHLLTPEVQLGFIDVPGHERFLKNLLAGIGGIDFFLLCVGADEGVKAQTVEHARILRLLGLRTGFAALTKRDAVDAETLELRQLEVHEFLEKEGLPGIPVLPVSAVTGEGIDDLRARLLALPAQHPLSRDLSDPFLLPIDRVFSLSGAGAITTGTMIRGTLRAGDPVLLLPDGREGRVRSIEVHGARREVVEAGERTAVNVAGFGDGDLARGKLLTREPIPSTRRLTVRLETGGEVKEHLRVRFAHWTRETLGRLHLLDGGRAQIVLEEEVTALRGDRFILRHYSPPDLLGGGVILDPWAGRLRPGEAPTLGEGLAGSVRFWLGEGGMRGVPVEALRVRAGFPPAGVLEGVLGALGAVAVAGRRWLPEAFEALKASVEAEKGEFLKANPWAAGMPLKAALKAVADHFSEDGLEKVAAALGVETARGEVPLKSGTALAPELRRVLDQWKHAALQPPKPEEAAAALGLPLPALRKRVEELIKLKLLTRVSTDYYVEKEALDAAVAKLRATGWEKFGIAQFKDLLGLSRKHAVPLLEYLDGQRVTIRAGDLRILKK
jgi:selenocysteine-specific elongation factor